MPIAATSRDGLTYSEVILPMQRPRKAWIHKAIGAPPERCNRTSTGARSLRETAALTVCSNVHLLSAEDLRDVPEPLTAYLWKLLERHNLDSVHAWMIFVAASPQSAIGSTFALPFETGASIADTIKPISSVPVNWLTILWLHKSECTTEDWREISSLPNLGALIVGNLSGAVTDRTLHMWKMAAQEVQAFPVLQVLILFDEFRGLSARSLEGLSSIIALEWIIVRSAVPTKRTAIQLTSPVWYDPPKEKIYGLLNPRAILRRGYPPSEVAETLVEASGRGIGPKPRFLKLHDRHEPCFGGLLELDMQKEIWITRKQSSFEPGQAEAMPKRDLHHDSPRKPRKRRNIASYKLQDIGDTLSAFGV